MALEADDLSPAPDTVILDDGDPGESPVTRTVEDFARDRGWRPKEEYRGDSDDWRDAEQFLAFGLDRGRDVAKDLKGLREHTERLTRTQAQIIEDNVRRAREEERDRLMGAHRKAVEDGDVDRADQIVTRIADMSSTVAAAPPVPAEVEIFRRENDWFDRDTLAQSLAVATADQVAKRGGPVSEQLQAARDAVHKRFPEYAPERPKAPASVAQPGSRTAPTGGRKKGFSDLPRDAQDVARQLKSRGMISSVDSYADQYFSGKGA